MQKDKFLKQRKEQEKRAALHQVFRTDLESSQGSLDDSHQEVLPSPRSPVFGGDDAVVLIVDVQGMVEIEPGVNEHRGQEEILPLQEPA